MKALARFTNISKRWMLSVWRYDVMNSDVTSVMFQCDVIKVLFPLYRKFPVFPQEHSRAFHFVFFELGGAAFRARLQQYLTVGRFVSWRAAHFTHLAPAVMTTNVCMHSCMHCTLGPFFSDY